MERNETRRRVPRTGKREAGLKERENTDETLVCPKVDDVSPNEIIMLVKDPNIVSLAFFFLHVDTC